MAKKKETLQLHAELQSGIGEDQKIRIFQRLLYRLKLKESFDEMAAFVILD